MPASRLLSAAAAVLVAIGAAPGANSSADDLLMAPLTTTEWGQRWAFAQFAPRNPAPRDQGLHERLGCLSTALAQIMFFHRRCPAGAISYTAAGFAPTAMNFSAEAGLCDWSRFALAPPNSSSSPTMAAVARYEYAAALVVKKTWGTGSYGLSHLARAAAAATHYGMKIKVVRANETADSELQSMVRDAIGRRLPVQLEVVIDGYSANDGKFLVHLNVGHSGFDNVWYDWSKPVCLKHYQNGTVAGDGGCAFQYDVKNMLWMVE